MHRLIILAALAAGIATDLTGCYARAQGASPPAVPPPATPGQFAAQAQVDLIGRLTQEIINRGALQLATLASLEACTRQAATAPAAPPAAPPTAQGAVP